MKFTEKFRRYLLFVIIASSYYIIISTGNIKESPTLLKRIKSNLEDFSNKNFSKILYGREILWTIAIEMFKDNKLSGIGLGQFITKVSQYSIKIFGTKTGKDLPQNMYLRLIAETGFLPIIFFFWFIANIIIYLIKKIKTIKESHINNFYFTIMFGIISNLVTFFFNCGFNYPIACYLFFLLVGLILQIDDLKKQSLFFKNEYQN